MLLVAVAQAVMAQAPVIGPPVNAFSLGPEVSPGVLAQIFGQNLSASPTDFCFSSELPQPTVLPPCNAMVLINGDAAPLSGSSAGQISFQFPFDGTPGPAGGSSTVQIVVDVNGARSEPLTVELQRFAPAFNTSPDASGTQIGAFFRLTGESPEAITTENRASPGDTLQGFAVGLGPTEPFVPAGTAGSGNVVAPVRVLIEGDAKAVREAQVLGATLTPTFVGTYTVNFTLPEDLPLPINPGYFYRVEMLIEDGGEEFRSPQVLLAVEQGEHEITGVLDAAGFQAQISPGSIVSVFGEFAETTARASSIPLSMDLNGFSVTFNDIPGALFGVFGDDFGLGFNQANVQAPWAMDVSSGKVAVKVHWEDESGEVWSDPFEVDAAQASPGIYMFPAGTTQAIVTNFKLSEEDDVIAGSWAQPTGSIPNVVTQPAAIGGVATIWCNGLGPVTPEPATGDLPMPPGTAPFTDKTVRVFVGGEEAQVLGAVLQSSSVGLNQINIFIPAGVTPGDAVPIVIEVECDDGTKIRSRDDVTIAVRAAP
jgi:uncharacterized protein (TIGR03437 family)